MSDAAKNSLENQLKAWKKGSKKAQTETAVATPIKAQKPLSDAEQFACAVHDVTPLTISSHTEQAFHKNKPRPEPHFSRAGELEVLEESLTNSEYDPESAADLHYVRAGLQHRVVKKLGKGQYAISAELDLHGLNAEDAHNEVRHFLAHCSASGKSCVRIIHGKGLHSDRSPVLKSKLGGWLRRRNEVLAFTSARPVDGGSGAIYVLLKIQ